jgi:hypothetical protein
MTEQNASRTLAFPSRLVVGNVVGVGERVARLLGVVVFKAERAPTNNRTTLSITAQIKLFKTKAYVATITWAQETRSLKILGLKRKKTEG